LNIRKNLVWLHRVLGVSIGVFAIVLSVSGFLLLFANDYERWRYPQTALPLGDAKAFATALEKIENSAVSPIKLVKFPQPDFNVFTVWHQDETKGFYNPITGQLISLDHWYESLMAFILRLHTQLLLWDEVELVNGIAGILILFVLFSGLMLWQSRRKYFQLRFALKIPKSFGDWIRLHSAWGVIASGVLLIAVSTGCIMVFYGTVAKFIVWATDEIPKIPSAVVEHQDKPRASWSTILKVVENTFPEGQLIYFSPGKPNNAVFGFRKRMPEEWHPNGRSFVLINPYDSSVLQKIDARSQPLAIQILEKVYPVHGAFVGGVYYKVILGMGAIVLTGLSFSGIIMWRVKKRSF
jgi:uncharacterized iron-regulated membrane protein